MTVGAPFRAKGKKQAPGGQKSSAIEGTVEGTTFKMAQGSPQTSVSHCRTREFLYLETNFEVLQSFCRGAEGTPKYSWSSQKKVWPVVALPGLESFLFPVGYRTTLSDVVWQSPLTQTPMT